MGRSFFHSVSIIHLSYSSPLKVYPRLETINLQEFHLLKLLDFSVNILPDEFTFWNTLLESLHLSYLGTFYAPTLPAPVALPPLHRHKTGGWSPVTNGSVYPSPPADLFFSPSPTGLKCSKPTKRPRSESTYLPSPAPSSAPCTSPQVLPQALFQIRPLGPMAMTPYGYVPEPKRCRTSPPALSEPVRGPRTVYTPLSVFDLPAEETSSPLSLCSEEEPCLAYTYASGRLPPADPSTYPAQVPAHVSAHAAYGLPLFTAARMDADLSWLPTMPEYPTAPFPSGWIPPLV